MKILATFLFVNLLALSSGVMADATETGKVNKIKINSNDTISIFLDGPNDTTDCSGGKQWIIETSSDSEADKKYSLVLAAASARISVTLNHFGSSGCGAWSANKVDQATLSFTE